MSHFWNVILKNADGTTNLVFHGTSREDAVFAAARCGGRNPYVLYYSDGECFGWAREDGDVVNLSNASPEPYFKPETLEREAALWAMV